MSAHEAKLLGGGCRTTLQFNSASSAGGGRSSSSSGPSATTVTLLAVSFYLIATTLPVTIVYAVYFSFPTGDPGADVASDVTWQRHLTYWTVRTVVQEVGMSHYAGNFLIYVATGRIFRAELGRLLSVLLICRPCRAVNGGRGHGGSQTTSSGGAAARVTSSLPRPGTPATVVGEQRHLATNTGGGGGGGVHNGALTASSSM